MNRGTASRVFIGADKSKDDFGGLLLLSQVILGKKSGMFTDHTGLYITDNVMLGKGIARVITVIIRGTSPLSLPDAIAGGLQYVKAFGGTEQRNLPDGYLQRQFIYMMDESYIDTGVVPDNAGKIEIDFQTTSVQTRNSLYLGARSSASTGAGVSVAHTNTKEGVFDAFGQRFSPTQTFDNNTRYLISYDNGTIVWKSGSTVIYTNTSTPTDTTTHSLYINALNNAGTVYGNYEGIYLYSFKVWNAQGVLVADYVPAVQKGAVPVVGFYDTVSKTFKTATAGTFAAGGEAVPTPDAPMDIVSNNGVLKARHASGLPLGYTLLDYIESSGTQYIDTGVVLDKIASEVFVTFKKTTTTNIVTLMGSQDTSSGYNLRQTYYYTNNELRLYNSTGFSYSAVAVADTSKHTIHTIIDNNNNITLNIDGITKTFTQQSDVSDNTLNLYLFANNSNGSAIQQIYAQIYRVWVKNSSGTLVFNGIPAKNSSNVIGMYDTVTDTFFTNAGTGDFVAGNTVSDPVEIYADGMVETINVHGKNLFDYSIGLQLGGDPTVIWTLESGGVTFALNQATGLYTVSGLATGTGGRNTLRTQTFYLPAGTYTISATNSPVINILLVNETTGNTIAQTQSTTTFTLTETTPLHFGLSRTPGITYNDSFYLQIEQGSTATTYEPYYDGGTATAEMLLSLGDYTDEQEIISGVVTRKLDVKVFDGTEYWRELTNSRGYFYGVNANDPCRIGVNYADAVALCTHFNFVIWSNNSNPMPTNSIGYNIDGATNTTNGNMTIRPDMTVYDTVEKWKAYLAEQYANGTPVIVVRMIEPTTDTVTGQPMNTTAGDNILEITQASLDGLELEVQYQAAVLLTIQEVQDANLDPNVEVTIN